MIAAVFLVYDVFPIILDKTSCKVYVYSSKKIPSSPLHSVLQGGSLFTGSPVLQPRCGFLVHCTAQVDPWDVFLVMST